MDQIKIGEFIAQKRKEQGLTQMQFAELVGVSNKTVSKWETGSRMPDVAIIQEVCDVLKISVNELLAGEEFAEKEFIQKTEDNIIGLVQELDEIKETKTSRWLGILCGILIIMINATFGRAYQQSIFSDESFYFNFSMFLDGPILFYIFGMFFLMLGVTGAFTRYIAGYKCWLNIKNYNENEMNKIICTLEYANKLILLIGLFVMLVNIVAICMSIGHTEAVGPFLAATVLSLIYMVIIEFIHNQVLYKCKLIMLERTRNKKGGLWHDGRIK